MKPECNSLSNGSETSGGKTPFQRSGNLEDFNEAIDQPFEVVVSEFAADASLNEVPLGMAILRFATLLEAIDHHLYYTGEMTLAEARERIRWAANLMDKKFDLDYRKLPQ